MSFYEIFQKKNIGKKYNMYIKEDNLKERVFLELESGVLHLYINRTSGKKDVEKYYSLMNIVNAKYELIIK